MAVLLWDLPTQMRIHIQANLSNMIRKILDCFKHDFIKMTTGSTALHQSIQGGHPLIYIGHLDGNQAHAHAVQWPEPNH
jgi:hypothetical protein